MRVNAYMLNSTLLLDRDYSRRPRGWMGRCSLEPVILLLSITLSHGAARPGTERAHIDRGKPFDSHNS